MRLTRILIWPVCTMHNEKHWSQVEAHVESIRDIHVRNLKHERARFPQWSPRWAAIWLSELVAGSIGKFPADFALSDLLDDYSLRAIVDHAVTWRGFYRGKSNRDAAALDWIRTSTGILQAKHD